ncbi:MAG: hypothetical protein JWQ97_4169 [Phenylobacterium sp.]|nr:hypothetical protein [Phenylobacterium sp.]
MSSAARLLNALRDAAWLDAARARAWSRILLAMMILVAAGWALTSAGGLDRTGKPLGTDFVSFWAAGRLVDLGAPAAAAYDPLRHGAVEHAAVQGAWPGYTPFPYPPSFLLVCLPFGLLPYLPALALWVAATGAAFWAAARRWLPAQLGLVPVLAYPAVLINAANGQNGFLTAALFGAGALAWGRRPVLSGVCLGLLSFKPHLGLLIPVALVAAGQWRAIAGAAAAALGLALVATALFGLHAWAAFLPQLAMMRQVVEAGLLEPGKVISLFAALRLWGAPRLLAYAAQAALVLACAAAVFLTARRRPDGQGSGALLIAGALLASPYLLDYDLTLAVFPMAWVLSRALKEGFRPWEKAALLAAYVLPLVCRTLALNLHLPLAPLVLAGLFLVTLRRAWAEPEAAHA